jgi:hypothetical protein
VRNVEVFQFAQDQLQLRHLLLVGLADHDRGVDRRQRRAHVMDEFDRTRAIDKSVAVAHESRGGDRSLDAHLVLAGFLAGVADGSTRVHRALPLHRPGARENCFQQCGFAALKRAHQRDAPWTLIFYDVGTRAVLSHKYLPYRPGGRTKIPALSRHRLR